MEVTYVDDAGPNFTVTEGAGQGEPAAKRLKVVEDSTKRSFAEYGGRLVQVKQVPDRVPRSLNSSHRTLSRLK